MVLDMTISSMKVFVVVENSSTTDQQGGQDTPGMMISSLSGETEMSISARYDDMKAFVVVENGSETDRESPRPTDTPGTMRTFLLGKTEMRFGGARYDNMKVFVVSENGSVTDQGSAGPTRYSGDDDVFRSFAYPEKSVLALWRSDLYSDTVSKCRSSLLARSRTVQRFRIDGADKVIPL
jgi:hypothetical protein